MEDQKLEPVVDLERWAGVPATCRQNPAECGSRNPSPISRWRCAAPGLARVMVCEGEAEPVDFGNPTPVGPPKIILHQLDSRLVLPGAEEGHRHGVLMPGVTLVGEWPAWAHLIATLRSRPGRGDIETARACATVAKFPAS